MTIFHNCLFYKVSQKKHSYKIFCRCSHGMRAVEHAIIAMCRTLCPHSPAHKILGNHSCVFSNFSNFVTSHESSGAENFIRVFFLGHPVVVVVTRLSWHSIHRRPQEAVPPVLKHNNAITLRSNAIKKALLRYFCPSWCQDLCAYQASVNFCSI